MINALKAIAIAIAIPAVVLSGSSVYAAAEGQIEGGDIYYAKNVTKGTAFGDPISADKCETVQYRVRVHNPGPGEIQGVNVKATLPASAINNANSTVTVSSVSADPADTSDTANVNLSGSYKTSYIAGSTQLLGASGEVLNTLPDTILGGGVNIGAVGVSLGEKRFVQFSAKVDCPETPGCTVNCTPTPPKTPETPKTKTAAPSVIAATGPEALLGGLAGTGALGYGVTRYAQSRRLNK